MESVNKIEFVKTVPFILMPFWHTLAKVLLRL